MTIPGSPETIETKLTIVADRHLDLVCGLYSDANPIKFVP